MRKRCFADRKDGKCHALIEKECKNCKFYLPRELLKNNPFYEFSYQSKIVFKYDKKMRHISDDQVMKKND